jgi:putative spermidine/putrescine transport system permease protein
VARGPSAVGRTADGRARIALRLCWSCFSLPGALVLSLGFLLPMGVLAVYSVARDGRNGRIIFEPTLENYARILTDSFYLQTLAETIALGLLVAAFTALLGYPVAYFLARNGTRWRPTLIFLVLVPLMVSSVIRNIGWIPILGENGAINTALLALHVTDHRLALIYNFTGVVIGLTHALLPLMILMLLTVIQRVKPELEEAALNLGASPWALFWRVLFPLTRRGLAAGFILVFALAVSSYTTPAIMGGGKVLVMSTFIAQQISFVLKYAFGSALTIVLLVAVILLTLLSTRWMEQERRST